MRKIEKVAQLLNDDFRDHLRARMLDKFGITVKTEYAFLADRLITTREYGADFTPEELTYLEAWSDGYGKALDLVRSADLETLRS